MNIASSPTTTAGIRAPIVPWVAALLVVLAAAYGLATLWAPLHAAWSDIYGAFSHGYLVLALSVWLGVTYWRRHPPAELRPNWIAIAALLGLVVALVAMDLLFLQSSRLVLLPLLALATVASLYGIERARVLLWPTLYLYCALPQWWVINSTLQTLTTRIVSGLIDITRLPAYVEGNFIHVPAGVFEIASGCSGLNYLVAAVSLAGFYALMYFKQWRNYVWLLGVAVALAILSNFARVYALIVIGIVTDMRHYLVTVEHLYFGWAIFAVAMIPLFWLARRLDLAELGPAQASPAQQRTAIPDLRVAWTVIPAALIAALILLMPRFASVHDVDAAPKIAELPHELGQWLETSEVVSGWRPAFVNAQEQRVDYESGSQRVEVYRAVYPHQTSEQRVIRADNDFFGAGWRLAEQRSLAAEQTGFAPVSESRGYFNDQEKLIWSWYVVAGVPASSKLDAKLREIQGLIKQRRDAMAIALATDCLPSCDAARARLREFTQASAASLQRQ